MKTARCKIHPPSASVVPRRLFAIDTTPYLLPPTASTSHAESQGLSRVPRLSDLIETPSKHGEPVKIIVPPPPTSAISSWPATSAKFLPAALSPLCQKAFHFARRAAKFYRSSSSAPISSVQPTSSLSRNSFPLILLSNLLPPTRRRSKLPRSSRVSFTATRSSARSRIE